MAVFLRGSLLPIGCNHLPLASVFLASAWPSSLWGASYPVAEPAFDLASVTVGTLVGYVWRVLEVLVRASCRDGGLSERVLSLVVEGTAISCRGFVRGLGASVVVA